MIAAIAVLLFSARFLSAQTVSSDNTASSSVPKAVSSTSEPSSAVPSSDTAVSDSGSTPPVSTTESAAAVSDEKTAAVTEETKPSENKKAVVPPAKRPMAPDKEKVLAAEQKDNGKDTVKETQDTLKFGIETDITALIEKLTLNDDPRFSDDIYDLFESTKSVEIRKQVLAYFTKMKDPCIEDYAVTILNDPHDETDSLVSAIFKYVSAVQCKAAVPAVITLLDNDEAAYFDDALSTLGEIGSEDDAVKIASYMDREDLSVPQRQTLVKVLGKIKAEKTLDKLTELAKDSDENMFVRAYAAESIGTIGKPESLPVLEKLFEETDPNLRQYVIKGIKHYDKKDAGPFIIQGIRDSYYKVRLEAIQAADELDLSDAMPYLIYRAKNDPEGVVKDACYPVIAKQNTAEGNEFLVSVVTDKKAGDTTKSKVSAALMQYDYAGKNEIMELAKSCLSDDLHKSLRYALGKQFAKYNRPEYAEICRLYLASKDALAVGTGLDIYANGKYAAAKDAVQAVADNAKAGVNQSKAKRILGLE